jgi:hypothetical protein
MRPRNTCHFTPAGDVAEGTRIFICLILKWRGHALPAPQALPLTE